MKAELLQYLEGAIQAERGRAAMYAIRNDKVRMEAAVYAAEQLVKVQKLVEEAR